MTFLEFNSKEEMIAYEREREKYYMQFLNTKSTFEFYRLWIKEIFNKEYRELKKKYDGYCGGWYRDEDGIIHALDICFVDKDRIKDEDILLTKYGMVFAFKNGAWMRIY